MILTMTKSEVFSKALLLIESGKNYFMCTAIENVMGIGAGKAYKIFPEILEFKPTDIKRDSVWFGGPIEGREKRIEVLKTLIEKYKDDNKQYEI